MYLDGAAILSWWGKVGEFVVNAVAEVGAYYVMSFA